MRLSLSGTARSAFRVCLLASALVVILTSCARGVNPPTPTPLRSSGRPSPTPPAPTSGAPEPTAPILAYLPATIDPTLAGIPTARFEATRTPKPTPIPPSEPTLAVQSGLRAEGFSTFIDDQGILHILGDIANGTDVVKEVVVGAVLYNDAGQALDQVSGLTATEVIPPNGASPFEVLATPPQGFAEFEVIIEGFDSQRNPRLDLEFENVTENIGADYRLRGEIANPAGPLEEYVQVVATLYDPDDRVIAFGMDLIQPQKLRPGSKVDFEIRIDAYLGDFARYELTAVAF